MVVSGDVTFHEMKFSILPGKEFRSGTIVKLKFLDYHIVKMGS